MRSHLVQLTGIALVLLLCPRFAHGAEFWDSQPVKVTQAVELHFPSALLSEGITRGAVRAVLQVDAEGNLIDFLFTAFTHRELAAELERSLPQFDFVPARERGQPIGSRFEVVFEFEARGAVISSTPATAARARFSSTAGDAATVLLARATELDRPVTILHHVPPHHPGRTLDPPRTTGRVVLDFYIDATGRPRMPVVRRATEEAFAAAVVTVLDQWRFEPPTRDGRSVVVRVMQEFVFSPKAGTKPAASS